MCLGIHNHDLVTESVPKFLGLDFKHYVTFRLIFQFYKLIKCGRPISLVNNFSFINSTRNIQIEIPLIHLGIFERSFIIRICRIWNQLPTPLKLFSYPNYKYRRKLLNFLESVEDNESN